MKAKLILVALLGLPSLLWANAGELRFVQGEVNIERAAGGSESALRGARLQEGDVIVTGASGYAQLLMVDDAIIAVRPETRLKVETYRYEGKQDGSERGVLNLVRGGFRSITGWIGRQNKEAYSVRTPTATIGIRGTDHEPLVIPLPPPGEKALGEPGTYNKVNAGQTYLQTAAGRVELGPNQVGFAPLQPNAVPVRLPQIPSFMRSTPPVKPEASPRPADQQGQTEPAPAAAAPAQPAQAVATSAATTTSGGALGVTVQQPILPPLQVGTLDPRNLPAGGGAAANGYVGAGGDLSPGQLPGNGALVVGSSEENGTVLLGADGLPLTISTSGGFNYSRDGVAALQADSTTVAGRSVNWGVYAGGTIQDRDGVRYPQYFFFMGGGEASTTANLLAAMPNTGNTLTFSTVGGYTKPLSEDGALGGTVNGISVALRNAGGSIDLVQYNLSVTDARGNSWFAQMPKPQPLSTFVGGAGIGDNLTVSCSGCPSAVATSGATGTGTARGMVIGNPAPAGVISSYALKAGSSGVAGAVLAK